MCLQAIVVALACAGTASYMRSRCKAEFTSDLPDACLLTARAVRSRFNGTTIGNPSHPEWLQMNFWSGGTTLNSGTVYGSINAPSGGVTVNSKLIGSISAKSLNINGSGSVTVSLRPPQ